LSKTTNQPIYLLNAIDELVTPILGEVIFCKDFAALVQLIACLIFMILRDKVGQAILIDGFENTGVSSSSPKLTFKFCKRPVRPDFLLSPSAMASVVPLLN
jgi:hypothetical protein